MRTKNVFIAFLLIGLFLMVGCDHSVILSTNESDDTININPTLIVQSELYGAGSERITKQNLVINTREEWDNLIKRINRLPNDVSALTEAEIDFSTDLVIAVFDEALSMGGRSIDITNVTEYPDRIVVSVQNLKKGDGSQVFTQPYHIVTIPVSDKKIIFQQEDDNELEEIPFMEYLSPEPPLCRWAPFDAIPDERVVKCLIINSNEVMEKYIYCTEGDHPAIDFSEHTLLLTCGRSGSSPSRVISATLFKEELNKYTLELSVSLGVLTTPSEWHFAILTPKIADEATITLGIRY